MLTTTTRFLQIEPTTRCNFSCGFCCGRQMPQRDIDVEVFKSTLDRFPALEHVELQGEGEPLMHSHFFEMAAYARARNIDVSFITNGSYFTPDRIPKILDIAPRLVLVSIESTDEAMFREIRGGSLAKVLRGIRALLAARHARGSTRPRVGFAVSVLKKTLERLPDIAALYDDLGLDGGVAIQGLQKMDAYASTYAEEMSAQMLSADDQQRLAELRGLPLFAERRGDPDGFYGSLLRGWRPESLTCPWMESGLYVDNTGAATLCCRIKDTERFGVPRLDEGGVTRMAELARAAADDLAVGKIPAACRGCGVAERIQRAANVSPTPPLDEERPRAGLVQLRRRSRCESTPPTQA